jgi:chromate transporter
VLPYVYQGAVENFGWLTPLQMIDGLALGETTPGPLIMVVTFVGFVGGYGSEVLRRLRPRQPVSGRCRGSHRGYLFTSCPLRADHGRRTVHRNHAQRPEIHGPLSAITAAVVGVILNLALFLPITCSGRRALPAASTGHRC